MKSKDALILNNTLGTRHVEFQKTASVEQNKAKWLMLARDEAWTPIQSSAKLYWITGKSMYPKFLDPGTFKPESSLHQPVSMENQSEDNHFPALSLPFQPLGTI